MRKACGGQDGPGGAPVRLSCRDGTIAGPRAFFKWLVGRSAGRTTVTEFLAHTDDAGRQAFAPDAPDAACRKASPVLVLTGAAGDERHYILTSAPAGRPGERNVVLTACSLETEGYRLKSKAYAQAAADALAVSVSHDLGNLITLLKAGHEGVAGGRDEASREIWTIALRKLLLLNDTLAFGYGPEQPVAPTRGDLLLAVERNALLVEMSYDAKVQIDHTGLLRPMCGAAQECLEAAVYMALLAAVRAAGPLGTVRVTIPTAADANISDWVTARFEPLGRHCIPIPVHDLVETQPGGDSAMHEFGAAEAMAIAAKSGGRWTLAPNARTLALSWPRTQDDRDSIAHARGGAQQFVVAGAPDIKNAVHAALGQAAARVWTYPSVTDALMDTDVAPNAVWIAEITIDWTRSATAAALRRLCNENRAKLVAIARTEAHARYTAVAYPRLARLLEWPVAHDELELVIREAGKA